MDDCLSIFIDEQYPYFIDKYLNTKTMNRIKHVTQFCGSDYTNLYHPLFLYTRFDHSLVVAHMTWHFTHDKKQTIAALLHDIGTPCFAHCIDYVFGDYIKQESSEKSIVDVVGQDQELLSCLEEDQMALEELEDLNQYPILENKSPKLCTDRLDGVLHTCYIWLHTHPIEDIKEIYENIVVLTNEDGVSEIGFKDQEIAEKFLDMILIYAKELRGNTDKYIMKYVSEMVKLAVQKNLVHLNDLYQKREDEIVDIFATHFTSWKKFNEASFLMRSEEEPDQFYISFATKKRNTIPLLNTPSGDKRIIEVSARAKEIYSELENYHDSKYAYVKTIGKCE